jgi:uncharacterized radical SAM superfamily Fe-S cluster-containing enzyme
MLDFLFKGHSIKEFLAFVGDSEEKRHEIHYFFCDLRAAVSGCLRENEQREAISYYEFSGAFTQYPVLSEIAVTYRCNLKCNFCYVVLLAANLCFDKTLVRLLNMLQNSACGLTLSLMVRF